MKGEESSSVSSELIYFWTLNRWLHMGGAMWGIMIGHLLVQESSRFRFISVLHGWSHALASRGWCQNSLLIGHATDQLPVSFLLESFLVKLKMSISDHFSPAVKAQEGRFVVPVDKRTTAKHEPPTTNNCDFWKQNQFTCIIQGSHFLIYRRMNDTNLPTSDMFKRDTMFTSKQVTYFQSKCF